MPSRVHARLLTACAVASLSTLAAPSRADGADPDPWWGRDKALHFGASAALAGGGYAVGTAAFDGYGRPLLLGAGVALTAGIGKEALDAAGFGDPSWKDLTWDAIGTAVGLGVALVVHVALGGADKAAEPAKAAPAALTPGLVLRF